MTLGQKIKKHRQALGLTQKALAGDEITRNMLSQIENDSALPSVGTLKMLAEKLDVPCGYLLSEKDDLFLFVKMEHHPYLLNLYAEKHYAECFEEAVRIYGEDNDSETAFLRCEAACKAAEEALRSGSMETAFRFALEVGVFAPQTQYETSHLEAVATLVCAVSANPSSPRLEFEEDKYRKLVSSAMREDLFHYLMDDISFSYKNPAMLRHMRAKKLMQKGDYEQAYALLEGISANPTTEPIGAYVLWRVYGDMESCAKNKRDFENAYRMSTKRMSLLTAFKS